MSGPGTRASALHSNVIELPVPLRRVNLQVYGNDPPPEAAPATIIPLPLRFFSPEVRTKLAAFALGRTLLERHSPGSPKNAEVAVLLARVGQEIRDLVQHGESRPFVPPGTSPPAPPRIFPAGPPANRPPGTKRKPR